MKTENVQLLVSIKNSEEVRPAINGGCDILDLKDPSSGALGMVSEITLHSILDHFRDDAIDVPISMALGDLVDWKQNCTLPKIPSEVTYLKMGFSRIADQKNWYSDWVNTIERIEASNHCAFQWIAVAYADWKQAKAIPPREVLSAAIENRCAGYLVDTYSKRGQNLLDLLTIEEIHHLTEKAQTHDLKIALAGSITHENLPMLSTVSPDIVGIRSAACIGNRRTSSIQKETLKKFREEFDNQFMIQKSS